ncbi:MAG: hypothetical protein AAF340_04725 [Pseudomonadota bacterium]
MALHAAVLMHFAVSSPLQSVVNLVGNMRAIEKVGVAFENGCRKKEETMKNIALASAFALAASSAFAGNIDAPIIEEEPVVVEETTSSAGDVLVPILFLIFAAAVAAN